MLIHNTKGLLRLFDTHRQDWALTFANDAQKAEILGTKQLALLSQDGKVQHFTIPTMAPIWRYHKLSFGFANVGWNMDNTQLGAVDGSGYAHLFYPQSGQVLPPKRFSTQVAKWVDVAPNTNQLYVSATNTNGIFKLEAHQGQIRLGKSIAHTQDINGPFGARRFGILSNGYVPVVASGSFIHVYKDTKIQELPPRRIIYHTREFDDGRMGDVLDMAISPNHDYAILAAKHALYLWYPPDAPYRIRNNRALDFAVTLANNGPCHIEQSTWRGGPVTIKS